jgi:hypothetical protein
VPPGAGAGDVQAGILGREEGGAASGAQHRHRASGRTVDSPPSATRTRGSAPNSRAQRRHADLERNSISGRVSSVKKPRVTNFRRHLTKSAALMKGIRILQLHCGDWTRAGNVTDSRGSEHRNKGEAAQHQGFTYSWFVIRTGRGEVETR